MSLSGIILGVINIAIVIAVLLLVGALILWFCGWMSLSVPENVRRGYIIVVGLIGLYMLVALLLGMPSIRIISFRAPIPGGAVAVLSAAATTHL